MAIGCRVPAPASWTELRRSAPSSTKRAAGANRIYAGCSACSKILRKLLAIRASTSDPCHQDLHRIATAASSPGRDDESRDRKNVCFFVFFVFFSFFFFFFCFFCF